MPDHRRSITEILDSMSAFSDFEALFGRQSLQCAFRDTHQHRKVNIETTTYRRSACPPGS